MIDVGQGDSTLIVTPNDKTILIDGGGSPSYDVGANILVPYLLDRKINKIDYVMISHFDEDHVGGILSVLENLEVGKVLIGVQGETCEQYEKFCKIIEEKQIPVSVVKKGDIIKVEKDIQIRILFPGNELITENILNNNSLVSKLEYKDFKILFTGDIEEVSEMYLVKMYSSNELKANILKVPHHGSKSSSTKKFLELVDASIALIGVGANNKFGHPNDGVIERLKDNGTLIYRTDKMGEIVLLYKNNNFGK